MSLHATPLPCYNTTSHTIPLKASKSQQIKPLPIFNHLTVETQSLLTCNTNELIQQLQHSDAQHNNDCFRSTRLIYQYTTHNEQQPTYYIPTDANDTTLVFDSNFECGNLKRVIQLSANEYDLYLSNDTNSTIDCIQWFMFSISNTRCDITYKLNIVNFIKPASLFNSGMQPCMYSTINNNAWYRFAYNIAYYKINAKHYQLTFTFELQHNNDLVYVSYHEPYSYTRLLHDLYTIQQSAQQSIYCNQSVLCQSVAGNDVYRLTITDSSFSDTNKRYIVISSRVHSGESNSSLVMHGIIQYLLSTHTTAQQLRRQCVFEIIPMLNPDGVILGNYRCNSLGVDLNRVYDSPNITQHPSIYALKQLISSITTVYAYYDIHGHSRSFNVFTYGIQLPSSAFDNRVLPLLCSELYNAFDYVRSHSIVSKHKQSTARITLAREFNIERCYTIECSLGGCMNKQTQESYAFNTSHYNIIGQQLCRAIHILINDHNRVHALMQQLADTDSMRQSNNSDNMMTNGKQHMSRARDTIALNDITMQCNSMKSSRTTNKRSSKQSVIARLEARLNASTYMSH